MEQRVLSSNLGLALLESFSPISDKLFFIGRKLKHQLFTSAHWEYHDYIVTLNIFIIS